MKKIILIDSAVEAFSAVLGEKSITFEMDKLSSLNLNDELLICLGNPINEIKYIVQIIEVTTNDKFIVSKLLEIKNGLNLENYNSSLYSRLQNEGIIDISDSEYEKIVKTLLNGFFKANKTTVNSELSNKEFVFLVIKILEKYSSDDKDIELFLDKNKCKEIFNLEYPLFSTDQKIISGKPRYYTDILNYKENPYYVTNHWYQPEKNKFLNWVLSKINKPYQKIIYGAPGTGKSKLIDLESKVLFESNNIKRVTFYDGYTYSQFIGSYKPVMSDQKEIGYEYVPGILLNQLTAAYNNPDEEFLIIIEEINRAKVDRVFGDFFQLLDRNKKNESEYSLSLSKEQYEYLSTVINKETFDEIKNKGLYLPNNLYIWATMNSADQGVYPMDTAFKRRWSFEYIPLNEKKPTTKYTIDVDGKEYDWNIYREVLNDILGEKGITEDRLIAPFFMKDEDFNITTKKLKKEAYLNKFLMYLFDDILKHNTRLKELIFDGKNLNFYKIFANIQKENIYSDYFKNSLEKKSQPKEV